MTAFRAGMDDDFNSAEALAAVKARHVKIAKLAVRDAERAEKDLLAVCALENWTPPLTARRSASGCCCPEERHLMRHNGRPSRRASWSAT